MPIDKIDVFANGAGASIIEPTPTEKGIGWVPGEQVVAGNHNYWGKEITEKLNEVITEGVDNLYPGTAPKDVIATRLWGVTSETWGLPDDTYNTISGGGSKSYQDLEAFYDGDNPRIMALHVASNANTIDVYDPRDMDSPSVDTSGPLLGLDVTGSQTWYAIDFCTDGTYCYVLFIDLNAAPDVYYVQKYRISDWATGVTVGWPAVGVLLGGVGSGSPTTREGKIIIADSARVAVVGTWGQTINDNVISVLLMSNGGLSGGSGDAAGAGYSPEYAIASDGTNLYWGYYDSTATEIKLCSALISNPAAGSGGAAFPLASGDSIMNAIICPAPGIIFSCWSAPAGGKIIRAGNVTDVEIDSMQAGTDATANNDRLVPMTLYDAVFDGHNVWIYGAVDVDGAGTNLFAAVWRIPVDLFVLDDNYGSAPTARFLTFADSAEMHIISPREISGSVVGLGRSSIVFDGRDIWVVAESRASQTLSGKIFRVPRANNR